MHRDRKHLLRCKVAIKNVHPYIAQHFQKSNERISRAAHFAIIKIIILLRFLIFNFTEGSDQSQVYQTLQKSVVATGPYYFKMHLTPKQFFSLKYIFAPVQNALRLFKLSLDFFSGCKNYEIQPSSVTRPSQQGSLICSWIDVTVGARICICSHHSFRVISFLQFRVWCQFSGNQLSLFRGLLYMLCSFAFSISSFRA